MALSQKVILSPTPGVITSHRALRGLLRFRAGAGAATSEEQKLTVRRWKVWLGNGVLVVVATLLGLFVAEVAVRIAAPRATSTSRADRYGLAMHYPGITRYLPQFGVEVSFNSAGMRDREHSQEKPSDTFRILVLGDSFMEAYQVPFEESLPSLLEQSLHDRGIRKVEVINAGVSGWGTDDALRFLTEYGLAYEPDLLVVAMTLHNDVSDNLREYWHTLEGGELVETDREPIPFFEFATLRLKAFLAVRFQLVQIYREVRHRGESAEVGRALQSHVVQLFLSPPPEGIERGFALTDKLLERVQSVADRNDAAMAVVMLPLIYQLSDSTFADFVDASGVAPEEMSPYQPQRLIMETTERLGIPTIDLLPAFRQWTAEREEPLYIEWDGHWNALGHRLASDVAVEGLLANELVR